MRTLPVRSFLIIVCAFASSFAADPSTQSSSSTFMVTTSPDHVATWTTDVFKQKFAADTKSIKFTSHDQDHVADAVPLLAVLKDAGFQTSWKMDSKADPKTKNFALRQTVLITGRDGYAAAISLGEMLPEFGNHGVWIAIDRDSAPLNDRAAPVELIVPDDVKPGRWIRGIASIQILSPPITPPTTQP